MGHYIFQRNFENADGNVGVKLLLLHFQDENNIHFIYSPHLDLSGYGNDLVEAKASFNIAFEDFINYTLKKKTLIKVLSDLGWSLKGNSKKSKQILAPSITKIIKENRHVSDIFDNYPVNTYHEEIGFPLAV